MGHLVLYFLVFFSKIFFAIANAAAPANQDSPQGSVVESTAHFQKTQINQSNLLIKSFSELYSETSFRSEQKSVITDSRLRFYMPLEIIPSTEVSQATPLTAYLGIALEKELNANVRRQYVQDNQKPHIGVRWQPLTGLTFWAEYNHRYFDTERGQRDQNDPRFGGAYGFDRQFATSLGLQIYAEAVSVPRIVNEPVMTSFVRSYYSLSSDSIGFLRAYAELYAVSSPNQEHGPSRSETRTGVMAAVRSIRWSATLFVYKPWIIRTSQETQRDLEALAVLGGTF